MDIRCPNRAGNPTDNINNTTTNNVGQNVVDENFPQLLDSRGGFHVTNVLEFDKEDFSSWKDRFLIYLDGLEPYLLEILDNGPFVPLSPLSTPTNPLPKPQNQWSHANRRLANQDKRLKSIHISCLPNNVMKSVIKCIAAQAIWTDLILAHEGPSETKNTKIVALRLKFNAFKALEGERERESEWNIHKAKNDSDVEEDQRSSSEFLADLNAEFHEKALLANQKRFYKRSGRVGSSKIPIDRINETCFACRNLWHFQKDCLSIKNSTPPYPSASKSYNRSKFHINSTPQQNQSVNNNQKDYKVKYKGLKAEIGVLTKKIDAMNKGNSEKGLVAKSFDWDEESLSSDDEGVTTFKALMAIDDEEISVGRVDARSCQWVEITMQKDQRKNLLSKFNSLKQEFFSCKSKLTDLKNTKALNNSYQNEITKLSLENESLKDEISDLKKAPGGKRMRKEKFSSKEVVFTKYNVSTSETSPEIPSDFESEGNTHIPLPSLPKFIGFEPSGTTKCLAIPKTKQTTDKVVHVNVKQKTETKSPPDSSTEKLLLTLMQKDYLKRFVWHLDSGYSRHMTRLKQYLHIYSKESGPKVVFGDNSSGDTEGYGLVNCNGITFTKVAYVNGLKHNLISISQLCDANFKVLFTKTQGTIFNQNNKVVLIAQKRRDVYVVDMSSYNEESNACFFAKASPSINWLWHKRPVKPQSISHNKYILVIIDEYSRSIIVKRHGKATYDVFSGRSPNISYFYVVGCPVHIHNHIDHLGKFDEKADDGFFLGYSSVAKAFRAKDKKEKDKIGTKPDKNGKRGEAGKSQKQLQSREQEKTEENAS
nr:retrovirus-related Pol polyprotein from transposon TNT 1-94 [Tanacetum cinerariifolium]